MGFGQNPTHLAARAPALGAFRSNEWFEDGLFILDVDHVQISESASILCVDGDMTSGGACFSLTFSELPKAISSNVVLPTAPAGGS